MDQGKETIDWLYREQLKVDDKWSIKNEEGFTWWADEFAQTIEVHGKEEDETGSVAHRECPDNCVNAP